MLVKLGKMSKFELQKQLKFNIMLYSFQTLRDVYENSTSLHLTTNV